jgi:HEPN domain-containing protein
MANAQTLYDKAAANLSSARILFDYAGSDEEQLNIIGFHLQQAMELVLKYLLEQNGIEYPKTHDIDQLVRIGNEAQVDFRLPEYLEDHAEMLSQWEAKSRYVLGYAIEARKVERALQVVDDYLAEVAKRETEEIERSARYGEQREMERSC